MYNNHDCDGSGPCSHGKTALLLTGKTRMDGGVILCRACWRREIEWRRDRNLKLSPDCAFMLPDFPEDTA